MPKMISRKATPVNQPPSLHFVATIGSGLWLNASPFELVLQSFRVSSMLTAEGLADIASLVAALNLDDSKLWANIGYAVFGLLLVLLTVIRKGTPLLKLAIFAVISNVMFYHRGYDFVTLLVPLAYVMTDIKDIGFSNRAVGCMTILNIAWSFFLSKLLSLNETCEVIVSVALQHALLIMLIFAMFASKPGTAGTAESATREIE